MAKRPSKHLRQPRPLLTRFATTELKSDGEWLVQNMPIENATKSYICPGCFRDIRPKVAHVVAWPVVPAIASTSSVADRRHWHRSCWDLKR